MVLLSKSAAGMAVGNVCGVVRTPGVWLRIMCVKTIDRIERKSSRTLSAKPSLTFCKHEISPRRAETDGETGYI
jgi:hypothetical protein